jgi:ribonucleotide reductase alpha subunit
LSGNTKDADGKERCPVDARKLIEVQSSNVEAYGYDRKAAMLYVRYIGGKVYRYKDVPELVSRGLKLAQSKGGFLQTYVKGYFQYEVVE